MLGLVFPWSSSLMTILATARNPAALGRPSTILHINRQVFTTTIMTSFALRPVQIDGTLGNKIVIYESQKHRSKMREIVITQNRCFIPHGAAVRLFLGDLGLSVRPRLHRSRLVVLSAAI